MKISAARSRKARFRSFQPMRKNFFMAGSLIAQGAPGQVQEDRFQVGLLDVDRADLDAELVGLA